MAVPQLFKSIGLPIVTAAMLAGAGAGPASQAETAPGDGDAAAAQSVQRFSGPPEHPRRHYRISEPARLTPAEASAAYEGLREDLRRRYARSGDVTAAAYQSWQRFNVAPYRSMTHGRRFVNNYANDLARDYGKAEGAGRLPVGSVIAKDSFVVTEDGKVGAGPLFVMEKMPEGFNYVTGDWRYTMVTAAGDLAGRTGGPRAERVEFCIACHLAQEAQDHLFFVPEAYRPAP